jgi:hypothetical protein
MGCASVHTIPNGAPSATMSLSATIDAGSTTTRTAYMQVLQDANCKNHENGLRGGEKQKFGSEPLLQTDPIQVLAGKPFYFNAGYVDARFGGNRGCSITAAFTPQVNHVYQAKLNIKGDVRECQLKVVEIATQIESPVDFVMLPKLCSDGTPSTIVENGQPVWGTMTVKVVTTPSK